MFNDFFLISPQDADCADKIFETLKSIVDFDSAYIYFVNPDSLKYSYMPGTPALSEISSSLKIKNALFGKIKISKNQPNYYTDEDKEKFETCALIISNIIKDIELSKIVSMQINALQDGIIEKNKEYKKVLKADKIKNEFLNHVSHELRTPLNSIIGFSESLSSGIFGKLNPKQQEYIDEIRIAGLHLLSMINEVLDMSKIEADAMKFSPQKILLSQVLTEVINILTPLAEKKSITIKNETQEIMLNADYQKVQQIFMNITGNAVKFTPNKGIIKIYTEINSDTVSVHIKDSGIGIPKKYHKKIFEKFVQISPSENSTGLGLAITKELVKMHKGKITVESSEGNGADFVVTLPFNKD